MRLLPTLSALLLSTTAIAEEQKPPTLENFRAAYVETVKQRDAYRVTAEQCGIEAAVKVGDVLR